MPDDNVPRKPPRLAAALSYDNSGDNKKAAPVVVAKGEGAVAEQIEALAREHHVPVEQDAMLTAALSAVPVGEEIPRQLYVVVAEVLSFAYYLKGRVPKGKVPKGNVPKGEAPQRQDRADRKV
ncbi:EscU/YscU/HrcU family type III secretion system export apparatus switch protein [Porticoccus sp. GXU_MW_L64]